MGDALIGIIDVKQGNPGCPAGGPRLGDKRLTAPHQSLIGPPGPGVDNVIHHGKNPGRVSQHTPRSGKAGQRRSSSALVQKNPVDCDQRVAVTQVDNNMGVPQFFKQGLRVRQSQVSLRVCRATWSALAAVERIRDRCSFARAAGSSLAAMIGIVLAAVATYQGENICPARTMAHAFVR